MFEGQFTIPHLYLKDIIRIFSKIRVSPTCFYNGIACWEWTGRISGKGYGSIDYQCHRVVIHKVLYAWIVGPVPNNFYIKQIDHLCRNTACCNPCHLELVTPQINNLRGISPAAQNAKKEQCDSGHPFTPENTILRAEGGRKCRTCQYEATRQYERGSDAALQRTRKRASDYYEKSKLNADLVERRRAKDRKAHRRRLQEKPEVREYSRQKSAEWRAQRASTPEYKEYNRRRTAERRAKLKAAQKASE